MEELVVKSNNIFTIALLAGILIAGAGCSWFDNEIPKTNNDPIPGAVSDIGITPTDDGVAGDWTKQVSIDNMGGMTKDGWRPVKNVSLPVIYFAYDRSVIGASERYKLEQVAKYLKDNAQFGLIIEGHCDENGSAEYNRALGERRAIAAKDFLANAGISVDRIKTISYGEDRPAVPGNTEEARSKNRRDELVLAQMK